MNVGCHAEIAALANRISAILIKLCVILKLACTPFPPISSFFTEHLCARDKCAAHMTGVGGCNCEAESAKSP